jgi:RHS repeat-associated protein
LLRLLQFKLFSADYLPRSLTAGGSTITYTYEADGNKLNKNNGTISTDYIDGIQYDNGVLSFVQTEEGRAIPSGGSYNYEYNLADHLGNTRVTFDTHTSTATIVQQDDYYPFGMDISRPPITSPQNYYLYNKKELQAETGQYDYGARFYDPVIARWTSVDPLAEIDRRLSPYNYTKDNPVRYIDPDGMWTETANGVTSDNPEEAQAFFRQLQQQPQPKQQKNSDVKQHPEVAKRDATSRKVPNAYQLAMHTAMILTAAKANSEFPVAAYKAGTSVSEFTVKNAKGFVRVSTEGKTDIEGRWLMKAKDIAGLSPEEIQAKFALPNTPTRVADANVPNGTIMRTGVAGANKWGPGGGIQYQIMRGEAEFENVRPLTEPVVTPFEVLPVEPIEPIEPIIIPPTK